MSKISEYTNSVAVLEASDLLDVSELISTSPDVYESRKMTGSVLANFIAASSSNILNSNGLTLAGNYSHDLASNTLTFNNGTINILSGGMGVVGATNVTGDGSSLTLSSFISSTGHQTLILSDDKNAIAVGTSVPEDTALVELSSTTKGFLKPRMSTTERDLILLPALGLEIFNITTNQSEFWDGVAWSGVAGSSVYSADDTIGAGRVATLTDNLTFSGGTVIVDRTGGTQSFALRNSGVDFFSLGNGSSGTSNYWNANQIFLGSDDGTRGLVITGKELKFIEGGAEKHQWDTNLTAFYDLGMVALDRFIVGGFTGDEPNNAPISFLNRTAIKGADTLSTSTAFEIYDGDTVPALKFEVRNNGDIYTNGTQGLSNTYTFGGGGSGDIASMTFTNGILTAVTTVP